MGSYLGPMSVSISEAFARGVHARSGIGESAQPKPPAGLSPMPRVHVFAGGKRGS